MGSLTKEQEAALDKLAQAGVTKVMQQVRDLGYYPKASAGRGLAERQLAWELRTVVNTKRLSPEQEAELQALQHASPKQQEEVMQQVSAGSAEDARAQGGDAGTGSRRRPAATNAEEDRRLSRRTDAS